MKVALLSYNLTSHHSGQSRFVINLANGLSSLNVDPVIFSLYISLDLRTLLENNNIEYYYSGKDPDLFYNEKIVLNSKYLARNLSKIIQEHNGIDAYVVLSDEALGVVEYLDNKLKLYISQGDTSFLYYTKEFRNEHKLISSVLNGHFKRSLIKHSNLARKYDILLANSDCTKRLMSFLYELPFQGTIYPPVATNIFKRICMSTEKPFAVSLLRGKTDPLYPIIKKLSRKNEILVVGGKKIDGLKTVGFVSDDKLASIYSSATLNLSPNTMEFFGYSIVEAMSCGTPSIAYDAGAAPELIRNEENGWIVQSFNELELKLESILNTAKSNQITRNCLELSKKYTPIRSASDLIYNIKNHLDQH